MKKLLIMLTSVLLVLAFSDNAFAQKAKTDATITVTLTDAMTGDPVGFATVQLIVAGEDKAYKYALSDGDGVAKFEKLKAGNYNLKAEMMGYIAYTKEITLEASQNLDLGEAKMEPDTKVLEAAKVSAVGNTVIVKKDTIEYNATAFKTTENDVLEDLLRKLPGVVVGDDGSITVNGQTISQVYVDGKTFFLNDPSLATKNIPAKIVEKVKVVQKKSDQAEFTGIDDGQETTVLDLTVQQGMMNGLIGNAQLGGGHDLPAEASVYDDYRFQSNVFLGNFKSDTQLSIIANANNANNQRFGGGGMGGGMMGGGMMGGMGGFGGGMGGGGGITTSGMLGLNAGGNFFDDRMEVSGNGQLNGSRTDSRSQVYKETDLAEAQGKKIIDESSSLGNSSNYGESFGLRLTHEFSKNTSIVFEPQISFSNSHSDRIQNQTSYNDFLDGNGRVKSSDSFSNNISDGKSTSVSGYLMFRQRLGLPGRTLTATIRPNFSDSDTDGLTQSIMNTVTTAGTVASITNQRTFQNSKSYSVNANATYTEPLGNHFYAEANYAYNWSKTVSEKSAWDNLDNSGFSKDNYGYGAYSRTGEVFNGVYSNNIINETNRQTIGLNMLYQSDQLRAQVGASLIPTKMRNDTERSGYQLDTTISVLNWSPQAQVRWEPNDNNNVRLNYRGNSSQPSISQMMPVPDNSNPMSQTLGNPSLAPYFSHNFGGEYRYNNRRTFSSFNIRLNGGFTQDPIVNATLYGNGNTRYSIPFNGKNTYNYSANTMVNLPIAKSNFSISNDLGFNSSTSSSYEGSKNLDVTKYYDNGNFDYTRFFHDYPDFSKSKDFVVNGMVTTSVNERFRLTYRADSFEAQVGASTRYSNTTNSINTASNISNWNNALTGSLTWNWSLTGMSVQSDVNYRWYAGYTTPMDPECIWNAEISKLILRNRVTMALRAVDILAQSKTFSVSENSNVHTETLSNTLGRYIILSFTWRFGSMGGRGNRGGMGGGMPMGGGRGMGGGMGGGRGMGGFGGGRF